MYIFLTHIDYHTQFTKKKQKKNTQNILNIHHTALGQIKIVSKISNILKPTL